MMSVKCLTFDVQWHAWGPCSGAAQWAHWWAGVCLEACALYQDYIFPQEPRRLTSKGTGEGWSDRMTTFWCKKGATLHSDRCNAKELPSHFIRLQRWSSRGQQLSTANTFFWFKKRRHFLVFIQTWFVQSSLSFTFSSNSFTDQFDSASNAEVMCCELRGRPRPPCWLCSAQRSQIFKCPTLGYVIENVARKSQYVNTYLPGKVSEYMQEKMCNYCNCRCHIVTIHARDCQRIYQNAYRKTLEWVQEKPLNKQKYQICQMVSQDSMPGLIFMSERQPK